MNIFNLEDPRIKLDDPRITRIKSDLELMPCDWWFRSICSGHVTYTAAAIYFNVNYYAVYHTRGVSLACII